MRGGGPDPPSAIQATELPGVEDVGQLALAVAGPGPAALQLVHVGEGDAAFGGVGVAHGGDVYDADAPQGEGGGGGGEEEGREVVGEKPVGEVVGLELGFVAVGGDG